MLYINKLQKVNIRGPYAGSGHRTVRSNKVKNTYFPGDPAICHLEKISYL